MTRRPPSHFRRPVRTWAVGLLWLLLAMPAGSSASTAPEQRIVNALGMEFVRIPAGTFFMGSPVGEPHRNRSEFRHRVTLTRPFYLQVTEVTVGQWHHVMGRRMLAPKQGRADMPVVRVSWYDCWTFIRRLERMTGARYLLPTEAQWEYAARAGSTTAYPWGADIDCGRAMYANNPMKYDGCVAANRAAGLAPGQPAPVKHFAPNTWGLYGMQGNVWEWCRDLFDPYLPGPQVDPLIDASGQDRVRRGGSWFSPGYACRSANRAYGHAGSRLQNTGFRLVLVPPDGGTIDGPPAP